MIVSFDFDTTLKFPYSQRENEESVKKFKLHQLKGDKVIIVTSRMYDKKSQREIKQFCKDNDLYPEGVYFTNGDYKVDILQNLNVNLHYDDDPDEIKLLKSEDIEGVLVNQDELEKKSF